MSQRLDHVVIHVADLDAATDTYARLGFSLTPRGHHSLGSSNHLAIFEDDYLELLGVEARNAHLPTAHWGHPTGLVGLVFKLHDADAQWRRLRDAANTLEGDAPRDFHRPVALPDGSTRDARFRTIRIAPDAIPAGRVFLCEHLTPELVWQPGASRHPNGVTGVAEYGYVAAAPDTFVAPLRQAFPELEWRAAQDRVSAALAGGAQVAVYTPAGFAARYGDAPVHGDRAAGLTLRTRDLAVVRALLARNGITPARDEAGRVLLAPRDAEGVALAFIGPA